VITPYHKRPTKSARLYNKIITKFRGVFHKILKGYPQGGAALFRGNEKTHPRKRQLIYLFIIASNKVIRDKNKTIPNSIFIFPFQIKLLKNKFPNQKLLMDDLNLY
jgi:hypothetical protein